MEEGYLTLLWVVFLLQGISTFSIGTTLAQREDSLSMFGIPAEDVGGRASFNAFLRVLTCLASVPWLCVAYGIYQRRMWSVNAACLLVLVYFFLSGMWIPLLLTFIAFVWFWDNFRRFFE